MQVWLKRAEILPLLAKLIRKDMKKNDARTSFLVDQIPAIWKSYICKQIRTVTYNKLSLSIKTVKNTLLSATRFSENYICV